jgi:hypothetical protein
MYQACIPPVRLPAGRAQNSEVRFHVTFVVQIGVQEIVMQDRCSDCFAHPLAACAGLAARRVAAATITETEAAAIRLRTDVAKGTSVVVTNESLTNYGGCLYRSASDVDNEGVTFSASVLDCLVPPPGPRGALISISPEFWRGVTTVMSGARLSCPALTGSGDSFSIKPSNSDATVKVDTNARWRSSVS